MVRRDLGGPDYWAQCYWCEYWVPPYWVCIQSASYLSSALPMSRRRPHGFYNEFGTWGILRREGRPRALCDLCIDWHVGQGRFADYPEVVAAGEDWVGGPYEPTGISRAGDVMQRWFTGLPHPIPRTIAEFLVPWHAP